MKHNTYEPNSPGAGPRPTPHTAPVAWPGRDSPATGSTADTAEPRTQSLEDAIALVLSNPEAIAEVIGCAPASAFARHLNTERQRHDGWNGERIATFLEVLADTGLVTEACRVVGMSRDAAYALRNRDPVVAAAWRAALTKARPVVADGILERTITGTVEHYYRDGVLVGERRHYESWLALAVLRRLDKLAEEDRADATLSARMTGDWQATLDALRSGETKAVPELLAAKADEADTPHTVPGYDPAENVWKDGNGRWMTTHPPPPGFDGYEKREWDGIAWYERACTAEEAELLDAHQAAAEAEYYAEITAEAEAERDAWFDKLRNELEQMRGASVKEDEESERLFTEVEGDPLLGRRESDPDR